jgi:hypothetical protein
LEVLAEAGAARVAAASAANIKRVITGLLLSGERRYRRRIHAEVSGNEQEHWSNLLVSIDDYQIGSKKTQN